MDDYSNDDASAAIQRARNAPVPTQADPPENAPEPREPAITTASYPASFNPHVTSTSAAPPLHAINPLAMPHGFMPDYAMLSNLSGLSLFGAAHLPGYQPRQSLTPQQARNVCNFLDYPNLAISDGSRNESGIWSSWSA